MYGAGIASAEYVAYAWAAVQASGYSSVTGVEYDVAVDYASECWLAE